MRRVKTLLLAGSLLPLLATAQTKSLTHVQYWFDQTRLGETTTAYNGADTLRLSLATKDLPMGIHSLYFRFRDSEGLWSSLHSSLFFVRTLPKNQEASVKQAEYWIDSDINNRKSIAANGGNISFTVEAKSLRDGLHTLYYRLADNEGMYSGLQSWLFMKAALPDSTRALTTGEYWVDGDYDRRKTVSVADGLLSFTLNASTLREGLHTLNYRMKDSHGRHTPLQTWMFVRSELRDTTMVNVVKSIEYWFDNDMATLRSIKAEGDTIAFSADASALPEGLHRLCYRAKDGRNRHSAPVVWAFYKQGNQQKATKISWYSYWWNNHQDKAVKESVKGDSTAFVFEKQLTVPDYAKSDGFSGNSIARFNILFGDDAGHTSPLQAFDVEYTDEQPPVSAIEADKEEATESVVLTWKANESNIVDYNVYYSEGDQPFVLWLPNTTKTTATFKGQAGKTYRFTVTARDKAGNSETMDEGKYATVKFTNANQRQ